jgi:O-acetyl-ADP-ribose deacetylase (regulator of RNase III)
MIKEVAGDILLSKAGAIAHGVAPHDDFKQGLALSLREHWPGMYKDFRITVRPTILNLAPCGAGKDLAHRSS